MSGKKLTVVYYTSTHYLDGAIETIQALKRSVNLHVLIEIAPESKVSSIVEVDSLEGLHTIESCERVLGAKQWQNLKSYFEETVSTNFVVHQSKKTFNAATLKVANKCRKFINSLGADVIHFDTISNRAIGLAPFLIGKKVFSTIHDPKPHTGEKNWKNNISRTIFFPIIKGFFFYSQYALDQFKEAYPSNKSGKHLLRFQPFSYITKFNQTDGHAKPYILFFGRLSPYKGIDILIDAIPEVLKKYPDESFVIAGKSISGYQIDNANISKFNGNVRVIDEYIKSEDLATYIAHAKFVVCPYRDATQSGVLMTAFAKGKPVIATKVGAFPEYIQHGKNGSLIEPNAASLSQEIETLLENNQYKNLQQQINSEFSETVNNYNTATLLNAYN